MKILLLLTVVPLHGEGTHGAGPGKTIADMSARAPKNVAEWIKVFESSALYRHDPGQLFHDFLDITICCFANQTMEEKYLQTIKRYTRDELDTFAKLMGLLIVIHEDNVQATGWYDALGLIYEHISSRSKASHMGQFFTPHEVCDMMARIIIGTEPIENCTIYDPTCGSGRLILAGHVVAPKHGVCYGADLDPMCAKMTAVNFWLHGIRGEVACMDSLHLKWYFAYHTHPRLLYPFITYLDEARQQESHLFLDAEQIRAGNAPVVAKTVTIQPVPDLFSSLT